MNDGDSRSRLPVIDNRVRMVPIAVWKMVDDLLFFAQMASPEERAKNIADLRRQFAEGEVIETDEWRVTSLGSED